MYQLGQYNRLRIIKQLDFGLYLDGGEDEILLPLQYVPEGVEIDDWIEVFIYRDSEDRLVATTLQPHAVAGEVAFLEIVQVNQVGAFADMGLMKDLLIPFREQDTKLLEGMYAAVYVFIDERTQRLAGTTHLNRFIKNEVLDDVAEGDEVELLVVKKTDLGYNCVINNRHWGLLYDTLVVTAINPGDALTGYIKAIRPDNKIDLTLRKPGYAEVMDARQLVLDALNEWKGELPLGDKSSPEEIYERLGISKKTFKQVVGALYKDQLVKPGATTTTLLGK